MNRRAAILLILVVFLVGIGLATVIWAPTRPTPNPCVPISIIYAPESARYMTQPIDDFNQAYAKGTDPITDKPLAQGQPCIFVTGTAGSSGDVMQGIVNAIIAPNNANALKPTIFMPAVSHWLTLANLQTGQQIFDPANSPATTQDPIVIAIWEKRLKAIQQAYPGQEIGWKELLDVINNPKGWAAYGFTGRPTVYYGHTDPYVSSSGLSTLIAEFYASARYNAAFTGRRLTTSIVNDKTVQAGVRAIHAAIKHYGRRTTEFKEYVACGGPDYLDFVALPEDEFLQVATAPNAEVRCKPAERLVALYPREGTFYHEHPFAIVNAGWVTPQQRQAAEIFRDYILDPKRQQLVVPGGFRPANPAVALGYPIVPELGVDPTQPRTVLDVPDAQTIRAVQQLWTVVKKKADVCLVMDVSGSMNDGNKIGAARDAALAFLDAIDQQNSVCLLEFNDQVSALGELDTVERNKVNLKAQIKGLSANGGTALFDSLSEGMRWLQKSNSTDRIRVIVLLSDGQDTASIKTKLADVITQLNDSHDNDPNPILVIPVCYGRDCDVATMNSIASAARTKVFVGDQNDILGIMQIIASQE